MAFLILCIIDVIDVVLKMPSNTYLLKIIRF